MQNFGMNFEFRGFVMFHRELTSKKSDWKASLFKFNSMSDIFEVVVDDQVAVENLKKLGDKPGLVKGVIENQQDKLRLICTSVEPLKGA